MLLLELGRGAKVERTGVGEKFGTVGVATALGTLFPLRRIEPNFDVGFRRMVAVPSMSFATAVKQKKINDNDA